VAWQLNTHAQTPKKDPSEALRQLLNFPELTFKSLLTVPHISFKSLAMWVDERQKKLYVVYEGQLLRLPLP